MIEPDQKLSAYQQSMQRQQNVPESEVMTQVYLDQIN